MTGPGLDDAVRLLPGYLGLTRLAHGRRLDTWDAWDEERRTRCVVKVLRADRRDDERVRAATRQEGLIVTSLAHPHLVRGLAAFDEPPALVVETLRGATLAAVVDEGPLGVPDVAELGLQLASVLGYLHRHDWLHLDVKPANVVVEHGKAVLIDLSLAGRPGSARPGAGTRGYLAPEQARGHGLTAAADVWGLGITLLECLSGELPYGDEATWDTRRRWPVVHRRLPVAPAVPDGLPADLRDLLVACVAVDPAARPRLDDVRAGLAPLAAEPPPDLGVRR
ncbi:serine/threonine protein kinase [Nocardioides dongxiaopingii]|uniref:serine/threonine-protein kinase n=1 Tax=Nocardioides sp. S-1144 TaxID=2582905 RepID=UPI00110EC920|nr:serine/threonine-protein kinase [Nocardioides sp. S-1144]QCW49734.1 serine/threonine protein kinase [Nocardioides sp. S-1144]